MEGDLLYSLKTTLVKCLRKGTFTNTKIIKIDGNGNFWFDFRNAACEDFEDLKNAESLEIDDISNVGNKIVIRLNRMYAFQKAMLLIFNEEKSFESSFKTKINSVKEILISVDYHHTFDDANDLSIYRMFVEVEALKNLSSIIGYKVANGNGDEGEKIFLTNKSNSKEMMEEKGIVLCGVVCDTQSRKKLVDFKVEDYRKARRSVLREKWTEPQDYWLDILTESTIKFDLLAVKPSAVISLDLNRISQHISGNSVSVFYNHARIQAILREFDQKVQRKLYLPLPLVEDVDFSLLKEQKEWELLLTYILHFPSVIRSTLEDIKRPSPHLLHNFLLSMAGSFSSYYRCTKILADGPAVHLSETMFARLYLIKGVQRVFHMGMDALGVKLVPVM